MKDVEAFEESIRNSRTKEQEDLNALVKERDSRRRMMMGQKLLNLEAKSHEETHSTRMRYAKQKESLLLNTRLDIIAAIVEKLKP